MRSMRHLSKPLLVGSVCILSFLAAACAPAPPAAAPPAAVVEVVATAGVRSATLVFADPVPSGAPITSFDVSVNSEPEQTLPTDRKVTGLTEGASYSFRVRACSSSGCALWSPKSNTVIALSPVSAPGAVTAVSASAGNQSSTLTFLPPEDGGSAITSYEVSIGGAAAQVLLSTKIVSGLTNGTEYSFRVRACNLVGCGSYSPVSNTVTPLTVPSPPGVGSSVSGTTISWSWNVPAGNGGAVTSFEVRLDGGIVQGGLGTSFSRAFGYSETHTLTVVAKNTAGAGSAGSASGRTVDPPLQPTVSISWDSIAVGSSPYVITTISNFPANASVTLRCKENTSFVFPAFTVSTNTGNYTYRKSNNQAVCYQQRGIPTYVSATVNGTTYNSNTIS